MAANEVTCFAADTTSHFGSASGVALDEFFEVAGIRFTVKGGIARQAESIGVWWIVHVIKCNDGVIRGTNALSFSILDECQEGSIEITSLVPSGPTT